MSRFFLGFDIGGTFTDFVLVESLSGKIWFHKCLTTPIDPADGALSGIKTILKKGEINLEEISLAIHGTTLATNALIEQRGAKTGLITTKGFRDILQMGKEQRYDIYDLFLKYPEPLVPRRWRRGISERLDSKGEIIEPLNFKELKKEIKFLIEEGVESIAVSFLHSYVNPSNERLVASLLTDKFPNISLSMSNEVVAEIREYERTVTTCANAYIKPLLQKYITAIQNALKIGGFTGKFFLMKSSGGTVSPNVAKELPIQLLESGPAGGAMAAAYYGALMGRKNLISFDMGGTTAKACLIDDGTPTVKMDQEAARKHLYKKGSGILIKTPTIDLIEIGAGGGSIAKISGLGLMNVGPESAGAEPGPACYKLGGDQPTVTDANLLLGYLNRDYFLGGKIKLDTNAAKKSISKIAEPLQLSLTDAAWGIHSIVNENMVSATRIHTVERGKDPRRHTLMAFGGAGPAHACRVGRILGVPEVVLPYAAGITSAFGFLIAPIAFEFSQSYPVVIDNLDWNKLNNIYKEMEIKGKHQLSEAGVTNKEMIFSRSADMRLLGQFHEIHLPIPNGHLGPDKLVNIETNFVNEYRRLYSHIFEGNPIMALTWRLRVESPKPKLNISNRKTEIGISKISNSKVVKGTRKAFFPELKGFTEVKIYDRYLLSPGTKIEGPAIFEERDSTAVIVPGDQAIVDKNLNLIVSINTKNSKRS